MLGFKLKYQLGLGWALKPAPTGLEFVRGAKFRARASLARSSSGRALETWIAYEERPNLLFRLVSSSLPLGTRQFRKSSPLSGSRS